MLKELVVMAVVPLMISDAPVGAVSIGTASARGDMRIDNTSINGNATVFNGSVIETNQASVDLRLKKGTEVTVSSSSRGVLYQDHFVLQQGQSELTASNQFQIEAKGLHVAPSSPSSRGVVSMESGNTVEVAALSGSFGVKNDGGVLLANVHPGQSMSFAMQAGATSTAFSGTGRLSEEGGHYFISVNGTKYEVVGNDLSHKVGKLVTINGNVVTGAVPDFGATAVITVTSSKIVTGVLLGSGWVVGGALIGLGAGIGVGYAVSNALKTSASTP